MITLRYEWQPGGKVTNSDWKVMTAYSETAPRLSLLSRGFPDCETEKKNIPVIGTVSTKLTRHETA